MKYEYRSTKAEVREDRSKLKRFSSKKRKKKHSNFSIATASALGIQCD
jgi:hypothetical protein